MKQKKKLSPNNIMLNDETIKKHQFKNFTEVNKKNKYKDPRQPKSV